MLDGLYLCPIIIDIPLEHEILKNLVEIKSYSSSKIFSFGAWPEELHFFLSILILAQFSLFFHVACLSYNTLYFRGTDFSHKSHKIRTLASTVWDNDKNCPKSTIESQL